MELTRRGVLRAGLVATASGVVATQPFAVPPAWAGAQPFLGEIMLFGGNFAPVGWARCDGGLIPIAENDALFTLIGTTYGGDGESTFALPDLRGRVPVHQGTGYVLGQAGGTETVTLTLNQIPAHTHVPQASDQPGSQSGPGNGVWAVSSTAKAYANPGGVLTPMNTATLSPNGGSQPHENMLPFLAITYCIALFGVFPQFS